MHSDSDTETPVRALNLELNQQLSFVRFYKTLREKPATTIRFFNRIEYYCLHNEDAKFAAMQVFKSLSFVKSMGEGHNKLDYVILNQKTFVSFVKDLLLVKQYRVEVYTNQGSDKRNDWLLEYKGSPGNLSQFEEILFNEEECSINTNIIAIKLASDSAANKIIGVSCVDTTNFHFLITEFNDNEHLSELEGIVIQLSPRECLIPTGNSSDLEAITKLMERNNILVTQRKSTDFTTENIAQDLNRLMFFKENQVRNVDTFTEMTNKHAVASLNAIIKYLDLASNESNFNMYKFKYFDLKRYVQMDSSLVSALNLLPPPGSLTGAVVRGNSVLGLLDCCRTPQGHRLLAQWLKQPLRDINMIEERHDIVEHFANFSETRNELYDIHLKKLPDLQYFIKKLARKKAKLKDLYRIYQIINMLPSLVNVLSRTKNKTIKSALVDTFSDVLLDMDKYQKMIEETLDMDMVDSDEYLLSPSFDEVLTELHDRKEKIKEELQTELRKAAKDLDIEMDKTLKLESTEQYGYFFRVTLKDEKGLRNKKKYKILDTIKGGVKFTTDRLSDLNDELKEIKVKYEQEQESIVVEIIIIAAGYINALSYINSLIAKLDVLVAFSVTAATAPKAYTRPIMHPEGTGVLKLKQLRHPCVEVQDSVSYIANDAYFNHNECTFYIITGPNMGGKSTYIRSVGVCVLMAHIGSLVPCDEAEISMCDSILVRIGATDCEVRGLSTFMLEMIETSSIIRSATKNSLVIIDELGRGTSTNDGFSLAWAIAEYFAKEVKCFTLFATHFQEVTQLADEVETVKNQHVTAVLNKDEFTLLYKVKDGACSQSYGIQLARMINFPQKIINDALEKHVELDPSVNMDRKLPSDVKRKLIKDGEAYIESVLDKFVEEAKKLDTDLNVDNIPEDKLLEIVSKLQSDARTQSNPYVQALINCNGTSLTNGDNNMENGHSDDAEFYI